MPNRLAGESSPYLLQHKDNPVDWYPWGVQARSRAREEDRPLLVSIGYSACHWCHVMAHESFEDPDIAALMNERFVCVKVDREERPDIDAICMEACQAMTGHGGWPLNAFLTPEGVPFYAGTYFPPESRHGLPSWRMVLDGVAEAWVNRRDQIREQGARLVQALGATSRLEPSHEPIRDDLMRGAIESLRASYDRARGGFGGAPKFPPASVIEFLLARGEREMSLGTLAAMARGGIYDQIGGGFARYSVDATWTVPHFEKMLYDNALLVRAYLHGWQVSGEDRFRRVCCETLDWALREMQGPEGGFSSALDADSEGVEGKFYVWTVDELREVLAPAGLADEALAFFEPQPFEHGRLILEGRGPEPAPEALAEIRRRLLEVRSHRIRPGLDDKRLTSWNALMISALADAGAVLERPDYLNAAVRCAEFLARERRAQDGFLMRTPKVRGFLEDHAYMLEALIALYEATGDPRWFSDATGLADLMIERFSDPERGGFFTTADDHEPLAVRRKDLEDSPIPSGNSAAAFGLLRLSLLAGEGGYERHALGVLRLIFPLAVRHPQAFGHLLGGADFYLAPVKEVAVVGPAPEADALLRVVRGAYRPHLVLAPGNGDGGGAGTSARVPLLEGREPVDGRAAAYVCQHFVCQAPVTTPEALAAAL
ncbi:MAG: thioredoxin domain-containing protein [Solirubrobacterales bacterium]|nr:thioredoxin domain-containing protein [Solirubrobacterales bacterium]